MWRRMQMTRHGLQMYGLCHLTQDNAAGLGKFVHAAKIWPAHLVQMANRIAVDDSLYTKRKAMRGHIQIVIQIVAWTKHLFLQASAMPLKCTTHFSGILSPEIACKAGRLQLRFRNCVILQLVFD